MVWTEKNGDETVMPIEKIARRSSTSESPIQGVPVSPQNNKQETPPASDGNVGPMINPQILLSEQAEFLNEQGLFLENGVSLQGDEYAKAISRFSRAQGRLIRAQNRCLRQAGIV